jgi:hypothetical protein
MHQNDIINGEVIQFVRSGTVVCSFPGDVREVVFSGSISASFK